MSLISIIIPVYNVEKYLSKCVESILAQGVEDFELLLVNDGSKDSSLAICNGYAEQDSRIKVLDKPN
jgi:glycosyltransferase involved in cell wall biosynthesis